MTTQNITLGMLLIAALILIGGAMTGNAQSLFHSVESDVSPTKAQSTNRTTSTVSPSTSMSDVSPQPSVTNVEDNPERILNDDNPGESNRRGRGSDRDSYED